MPLVATAVSIIVSVSLVAALVAYLWKSPVPNCVKTSALRLGETAVSLVATLVLSRVEVAVSLVATPALSRVEVPALSPVEVSVSLVAALVAYLWKSQISNSPVECPPERLGKPDFASLPNLSGSIRLGQMLHFRSHLYE